MAFPLQVGGVLLWRQGEELLAEAQSSSLGGLGIYYINHLYWMPLGASLGRCSRCVPLGKKTPGKTQDILK